jgi:hypothetical protein
VNLGSSLFSVLGEALLTREEPKLKLVLLDGPLKSRVEQLVISANRFALKSGKLTKKNFDEFAPYAVAVIPDLEGADLTEKGAKLLCNADGDFWAVRRTDELALLPLRHETRLIVSSSELEEASNKVFVTVMNSEMVLGSEYSRMFTNIMSEGLVSVLGDGVVVGDLWLRLHFAVTLVAAVYSNMSGAPRIKRGSLHLLHLESAFDRLRAAAEGLRSHPTRLSQLTDLVLPCFSLPNPQSGGEFDVDVPVHDAIIATINKNWGTTESAERSISRVKLSRNRRDHPQLTPPMSLESWPWTELNLKRAVEGHENGFLAWHLLNTSDPKRAEAFYSPRSSAGLTEKEFFEPTVEASPIEGEWSDGKPLVDRKISVDTVIAQAVAFDAANSEFVSAEVSLFLQVVPGMNVAQSRLSDIVVSFADKANLKFQATGHHVDRQREHLVIRGVFRGVLTPKGEALEFAPRIWVASIQCPPDLMQFVLPSLGRKVIMLPLAGTGYLVGRGLTYLGPQAFDSVAAPLDQQSEYEYEVDNGETLTVIAWSGVVPSNIKIEDPKARNLAPDVSRQSIRLVENLVAEGESMRIVQENV